MLVLLILHYSIGLILLIFVAFYFPILTHLSLLFFEPVSVLLLLHLIIINTLLFICSMFLLFVYCNI